MLIGTFFRGVRRVLGPVVLGVERLTLPTPMVRSAEQQQQVDLATAQLRLFQYRTCPFCVKVRRQIHRMALKIELADVQHDAGNRAELLQGGGLVKVPCLCITSEQGSEWLYESDHIIAWLESRFGEARGDGHMTQ